LGRKKAWKFIWKLDLVVKSAANRVHKRTEQRQWEDTTAFAQGDLDTEDGDATTVDDDHDIGIGGPGHTGGGVGDALAGRLARLAAQPNGPAGVLSSWAARPFSAACAWRSASRLPAAEAASGDRRSIDLDEWRATESRESWHEKRKR
jgi:hypothetical protein